MQEEERSRSARGSTTARFALPRDLLQVDAQASPTRPERLPATSMLRGRRFATTSTPLAVLTFASAGGVEALVIALVLLPLTLAATHPRRTMVSTRSHDDHDADTGDKRAAEPAPPAAHSSKRHKVDKHVVQAKHHDDAGEAEGSSSTAPREDKQQGSAKEEQQQGAQAGGQDEPGAAADEQQGDETKAASSSSAQQSSATKPDGMDEAKRDEEPQGDVVEHKAGPGQALSDTPKVDADRKHGASTLSLHSLPLVRCRADVAPSRRHHREGLRLLRLPPQGRDGAPRVAQRRVQVPPHPVARGRERPPPHRHWQEGAPRRERVVAPALGSGRRRRRRPQAVQGRPRRLHVRDQDVGHAPPARRACRGGGRLRPSHDRAPARELVQRVGRLPHLLCLRDRGPARGASSSTIYELRASTWAEADPVAAPLLVPPPLPSYSLPLLPLLPFDASTATLTLFRLDDDLRQMGEVQKALHLQHEGSFTLQVKNPDSASTNPIVGNQPESKHPQVRLCPLFDLACRALRHARRAPS